MIFQESLLNKIISVIWNFLSRVIPTKLYLTFIYKRRINKKLNIKNPQTLNEKLQWKKIYDKNPLYTLCADKYAVRDYVKEKIGEEYLIPLLFSTEHPEEIEFDKLNTPYIIKSNHGSGHVIIVKNKEDIHKKDIIKKCKKWLKSNFYFMGREPQYKNIKPKILVEKLLLNEKGEIPNDYKFNCFRGKVEFIQVDVDRFRNHDRSFFNSKWKLLPFSFSVHVKGKPNHKINKNIPEPENLKEMITIAEKLSKAFDYVRVDLYSVNNKIYFGELTFHNGSGFSSFFPDKYDLFYGKKLKLRPYNNSKKNPTNYH